MNSSIEKPESGKILVSLPPLNDKFFGKSVVMLAEHGPDGSFGFIVNKPAKIKLNTLTSSLAARAMPWATAFQ